MDFLSILSLANSIEGEYLGIGYGKGEHIREIINSIQSNDIPKRKFTFFDDFKKYAYGGAFDYRLDRPQARHKLIKSSYSKITKALEAPLAMLVINLENPTDVEFVLPRAFKKLVVDGVLYIPQYNNDQQITEIVNKFFDSNNLFLFSGRDKNYFINSGAFSFASKPKPYKLYEFTDKEIIEKDEKVKPFKDRYSKKVIPKFIPFLSSPFEKVKKFVSRSKGVKDKIVTLQEKKLTQFEDRVDKEVIPKFTPTPVLNKKAKPVESKVKK